MAVQREKRGRKGRGDREREEVLAAPFSLARPLPRCADTGKSENRKMTRKIISSHSSLKLKALSLYWRGPLFSNRLSDSRLRAPCLFDFLFLELFLSDDDEEKKQKTQNSNQTFPPSLSGLAGTLAGAGGGACQTVVMAPMTFLVTAAVTSKPGSDSG